MPSALPDELILCIISFLPLRGLIRGIGVSQKWRVIILKDRHSSIPRLRKHLLQLYLETINSPSFLEDRPRNTIDLSPQFDRQLYLDSVIGVWNLERTKVLTGESTSSTPLSLPEEYTMYILEWPAKAIIDRMWPGIKQSKDHFDSNVLSTPSISYTEVLFSPLPGADWIHEQAMTDLGDPVLIPMLQLRRSTMGYGRYMILQDFDHGRETHREVQAGHIVDLGPVPLRVKAKNNAKRRPVRSFVEHLYYLAGKT